MDAEVAVSSPKFVRSLGGFGRSQDGASTVEFLVVAVAACGFGILALNLVGAGVLELWGKVDEELVVMEPEITTPGS